VGETEQGPQVPGARQVEVPAAAWQVLDASGLLTPDPAVDMAAAV